MSQYSVGLVSLNQNANTVRADYDCPISGYAGSPAWTTLGATLTGSNGSTWRLVAAYAGGATGVVRIARLTGELLGAGMTLTNGASATVTATPSKLADWAGNVTVTSVGPLFSPGSSNWFAVVSAIDPLGDGLTLDRDWPLTAIYESDYIIHSGFSPIWGLPLIGQGDYRTAAIVNRGFTQLDQLTARLTKLVSSSPYTITRADQAMTLIVNAGSAFTINLPSAASVGNGWWVRIFPYANASGIVIHPPSGAINGIGGNYTIPATYTMDNGFRTFFSDGTNWFYTK